MSDFSHLLFMWFACHHIPVIKGLVVSCLSSMLKILPNACAFCIYITHEHVLLKVNKDTIP